MSEGQGSQRSQKNHFKLSKKFSLDRGGEREYEERARELQSFTESEQQVTRKTFDIDDRPDYRVRKYRDIDEHAEPDGSVSATQAPAP